MKHTTTFARLVAVLALSALIGALIGLGLALHEEQQTIEATRDVAHCLSDDGQPPAGEDMCIWDARTDGDGHGESFVMSRAEYEATQHEHEAFQAHVVAQDDEAIARHEAGH